MLDVGTSCEDALQVDPAALHIDPHVKQVVDAVQTVLPRKGILLEFLQEQQSFRVNHKVISTRDF